MKPIRILLADDHRILRMGLTSLLGYEKDFSVVGEAADGEEAIARAKSLKPDVVLMDLVMPGTDGVESTRRIKEEVPSAGVLILTTFGTSADVARALAAGASGALMKDTADADLFAAIRAVAAGERVLSPEIERYVRDQPTPDLTSRQMEILESVTRGLTNRDIAKQLDISSDAVKQHLNAICLKLGAANRTEAVAIALRRQLLKA